MSLLGAGYESSSDEDDVVESIAPSIRSVPVLPSLANTVTTSSQSAVAPRLPAKGLFSALAKPARRHHVAPSSLPLLMDEEEADGFSSDEEEEEEDNDVFYSSPPPQLEQQRVEEVYKPFANTEMSSAAATTTTTTRMVILEDDDGTEVNGVIAPTLSTATAHHDQATIFQFARQNLTHHEEEEEEEGRTTNIRGAKRARPAEELIRESIATSSSTAGLAGVAFAGEISATDIRREAELLQQREGGLLAVNLAKTEGISGKRNVQLSRLAQVAMKQKQDKDLLQ